MRGLCSGLLCVIGLLACVTAAPAQERAREQKPQPTEHPLLWMIEGPRPSFIYGTIHLSDKRVTALPKVVEAALSASDAVITEIPLDAATQMAVLPRLARSDGKSLEEVLPAALYKRADAYLRSCGGSIEPFNGMQTWNLLMQISLADAMAEGPLSLPLDALLFGSAVSEGKQTGGLETVDEQLGIFESMSEADAAHLIEKTLTLYEGYRARGQSPTKMLVEAYLSGDLKKIDKLAEESFDAKDAVQLKFRDRILRDRDQRMADRIMERLKKAPDTRHFFAVGAAHLTTPKTSVLELLAKAGIKMRRVTPADLEKIEALSAKRRAAQKAEPAQDAPVAPGGPAPGKP